MKKTVKILILAALVLFCAIMGFVIIKFDIEHADKIRIVYYTADSGYVEKWILKGEEIPLENISNDSRYGYEGWFTEDKEYVYESYVPTKNMKLRENYYYLDSNDLTTITVIFDNGMPNITYTYQWNNILKLPLDPVKEGYKFVGWVNTKTNERVYQGDPRESMTVKALWEKIEE